MSEEIKAQFSKAELDALAAQINQYLMETYTIHFHRQDIATDRAQVPQIAYQGVYMAELLRLAATLAIDIGMAKPVFLAAAGEALDTADGQAPRFG